LGRNALFSGVHQDGFAGVGVTRRDKGISFREDSPHKDDKQKKIGKQKRGEMCINA
jgi:hypothetical protein